MTVQVVAKISDLTARHLVVISNRTRTSTAALIERAVEQYLAGHPVDDLQTTPLNDLLTNKGVKFDSDARPVENVIGQAVVAPTPVHESIKDVPEPPKELPVVLRGPKQSQQIVNGVRLVKRFVRGAAQPGHINQSAQIQRLADMSPETIITGALCQRVGHTFYAEDLFAPGLWAQLGQRDTRAINKMVMNTLTQCAGFQDLGLSSNRRRLFVYVGKPLIKEA